MIPPFINSKWRGCALDRDRFDNARIPEELFKAIISAAGSQELWIARYSPDSGSCDNLAPNWESFHSYVFTESNWSLEYVLFDQTGHWAFLADADVTVVGACTDLAERIDQQLAINGTSLVQLTDTDFPGLDPMQQPGAKYLLAVSGR